MKKQVLIFGALALAKMGLAQGPAFWDRSGNMNIVASDFLGHSNSVPLTIKTTMSEPIILRTSNVEGLRMLGNNQFIGIGNANPLHRLSVAGNIAFNSGLVSRTQNAGIYWGDGISNGDLTFNTVTAPEVLGGANVLMRIAGNGNVIIGNLLGPANTERLDIDGNISIRGTHAMFNSAHGVIDWGSSGNGNMYFRTLSNQGAINTYTDRMMIGNNGWINIGGRYDAQNAVAPSDQLHIFPSAGASGITITQNNAGADAAVTLHNGGGNSFSMRSNSNGDFSIYDNGNFLTRFLIKGSNGAIGAGTTNPQAYFHLVTPAATGHGILVEHNDPNPGYGEEIRVKNVGTKALVVTNAITGLQETFRVYGDGRVYATEVNVMLAANFPDYVFSNNYKLMNLTELESFINKHHHLPNVPAATEVEKNGANLGELTKIQMEKIEELTLYVIELKKEIEMLKNKVK